MKILVTGGAGFIGSNFVRYLLKKGGYEITVLDKLTYAGNLENLRDVRGSIKFVKGDIGNRKIVQQAMTRCQVVVNFAAESHVDRSIIDAGVFVQTDVLGTYTLLEQARKQGMEKFIQIGSDEEYGSILEGSFSENSLLEPSSPYSASKAAASLLVRSYYITHKLPVSITRSSNNFGPFQHPEKFIPTVTIKALNNQPIPVYGTGKNVRDWIYVEDNCAAIEIVLEKGKPGEIYNVGAGNEKQNLEICSLILDELKKDRQLISFVRDRLGHDQRYSVHCEKMKGLGWRPEVSFEEGIKRTVEWYRENRKWWQKLI